MFKRLVRKDGSVVLLVPKKDTQATTFEVLYKVGSRQEPAHLSGVSHFIEHLMFKGTPSRPHTADIARELDSVGAEYNAFTGKEHTGYYVMADHGHLPMAMDTLSDMLHNSKLDPEEIEREKGVIIEEINMYEDNPLMYIDDVFENLLYQGSVLGRSIAGTREIIRGVKRQSLWNYYQKYYYHGNAVFGVAGNFDQVKFLRLLDKLFPISKKQARVTIKPVRIPKQTKPALALVNREVEQVQLMLGFRTMPGTDKRFLALQLLANILGGTMSSRLFIKIRERAGLCYFIRAEVNAYEDISLMAVHAGLNKDKIYEALEAIKEELNQVQREGVTEAELRQAKDNIRGRLILRLESSHSYLSFLSAQELWRQPIKDLNVTLKELESVSLAQVNKLAKDIITWPQSNLAIIGPFNTDNKFLKILK